MEPSVSLKMCATRKRHAYAVTSFKTTFPCTCQWPAAPRPWGSVRTRHRRRADTVGLSQEGHTHLLGNTRLFSSALCVRPARTGLRPPPTAAQFKTKGTLKKEHGLHGSRLHTEKSFSWFQECKTHCQSWSYIYGTTSSAVQGLPLVSVRLLTFWQGTWFSHLEAILGFP